MTLSTYSQHQQVSYRLDCHSRVGSLSATQSHLTYLQYCLQGTPKLLNPMMLPPDRKKLRCSQHTTKHHQRLCLSLLAAGETLAKRTATISDVQKSDFPQNIVRQEYLHIPTDHPATQCLVCVPSKIA